MFAAIGTSRSFYFIDECVELWLFRVSQYAVLQNILRAEYYILCKMGKGEGAGKKSDSENWYYSPVIKYLVPTTEFYLGT